ncbi:MAG: sugar nucleotide-binding protein [Candidatus Woesearchaeota archaeon]
MKVLLVGGKGFLGRSVKNKLKDKEVFVLGRNAKGKNSIKKDITKEYLDLKDFDVIVNFAGLSPLKKPKNTSYKDVHVVGVRNIIVGMKEKAKLIHISAIGANTKSENEYLRTKGKAEYLIKKSGINSTIIRPSIIFDKNNEFFKTLNKTLLIPFFPNIKTKVKPIYRKDLANLIAKEVKLRKGKGIIEACSDKVYTIYEFAKLYRKNKGYPTIKIPYFLFKPIYYLYCIIFESKEQYTILKYDNVGKELKKIKKYEDWLKEIN